MRKEKQLLLEAIEERVGQSGGFLVAEYKNLSANESRKLRNIVAEAGGDVEIIKKKMLMKAMQRCGLPVDHSFTGSVGLFFAQQRVFEMTKAVYQYTRQHENRLFFLCGKVEGVVIGAEELVALADLPSQDELRAQVIGLLQAPLSGVVGACQNLLAAILHCLKEKANQE